MDFSPLVSRLGQDSETSGEHATMMNIRGLQQWMELLDVSFANIQTLRKLIILIAI